MPGTSVGVVQARLGQLWTVKADAMSNSGHTICAGRRLSKYSDFILLLQNMIIKENESDCRNKLTRSDPPEATANETISGAVGGCPCDNRVNNSSARKAQSRKLR